jgi:hypothetical protein
VATFQTIGGAVQHSPGPGTVNFIQSESGNFIKSESGTSAVVWGVSRAVSDPFRRRLTNLDGSV